MSMVTRVHATLLAGLCLISACGQSEHAPSGGPKATCTTCGGGGATDAAGPPAPPQSPVPGPASPSDAAPSDPDCAQCTDAASPPVSDGRGPRLVAYVNCLCGFGVGPRGGACLDDPDPEQNHVARWEDEGVSPITHYVISFLSFEGAEIRTDPGEIWADDGGSTIAFALHPNLRVALASAQRSGKKVILSLGGELGSSGFLAWWRGLGASSAERVQAMRAELLDVQDAFTQQNELNVDGFDVDIELGGVYSYGSDKYVATRDLIDAVPDAALVAFVPQVGNGLCAAPVEGDPLTPTAVLGGQCQQPVNGDDSAWTLARLDSECRRADGGPKLAYLGIQYYNAGQAECCGGGTDDAAMVQSAVQHYKNLANGWPASGDTTDPQNPWNAWAYYPGPWPAFDGIGAERLVLGKPGCRGCAGSNYLDLAQMRTLLTQLDGQLREPMGGVLFWDLCRLFGNVGPQCVSGQCQPSWGGPDVLDQLTELKRSMAALRTR